MQEQLFDTLLGIVNESTLPVGTVFSTLGFREINDGGQARYRIIEEPQEELPINYFSANGQSNVGSYSVEIVPSTDISIESFGGLPSVLTEDAGAQKFESIVQNSFRYCCQHKLNWTSNSDVFTYSGTNAPYLIALRSTNLTSTYVGDLLVPTPAENFPKSINLNSTFENLGLVFKYDLDDATSSAWRAKTTKLDPEDDTNAVPVVIGDRPARQYLYLNIFIYRATFISFINMGHCDITFDRIDTLNFIGDDRSVLRDCSCTYNTIHGHYVNTLKLMAIENYQAQPEDLKYHSLNGADEELWPDVTHTFYDSVKINGGTYGYTNDNKFYDMQVSHIFLYGSKIKDYKSNNNYFYNVSLESSTSSLNINNGRNNMFICRGENLNPNYFLYDTLYFELIDQIKYRKYVIGSTERGVPTVSFINPTSDSDTTYLTNRRRLPNNETNTEYPFYSIAAKVQAEDPDDNEGLVQQVPNGVYTCDPGSDPTDINNNTWKEGTHKAYILPDWLQKLITYGYIYSTENDVEYYYVLDAIIYKDGGEILHTQSAFEYSGLPYGYWIPTAYYDSASNIVERTHDETYDSMLMVTKKWDTIDKKSNVRAFRNKKYWKFVPIFNLITPQEKFTLPTNLVAADGHPRVEILNPKKQHYNPRVYEDDLTHLRMKPADLFQDQYCFATLTLTLNTSYVVEIDADVEGIMWNCLLYNSQGVRELDSGSAKFYRATSPDDGAIVYLCDAPTIKREDLYGYDRTIGAPITNDEGTLTVGNYYGKPMGHNALMIKRFPDLPDENGNETYHTMVIKFYPCLYPFNEFPLELADTYAPSFNHISIRLGGFNEGAWTLQSPYLNSGVAYGTEHPTDTDVPFGAQMVDTTGHTKGWQYLNRGWVER